MLIGKSYALFFCHIISKYKKGENNMKVNKLNTDIKKYMDEIASKLFEASKAYYADGKDVVSVELMSNYDYDKLYDELSDLQEQTGYIPENSPTEYVGSDVIDTIDGIKEEHEFPALSLAKSKKISKVIKWTEYKDINVSWKEDGCTLVATYDNGKLTKIVTRGNGYVGTNITHLAKGILNLPLEINEKGHMVIRGEAIITYSSFNNYIELTDSNYENPRNLLSGSLNSKEVKDIIPRNVRFKPFKLVYLEEGVLGDNQYNWSARMEYLRSLGFDPVEYKYLKLSDISNEEADRLIKDTINEFTQKVESGLIDEPVDGLVVCYEDEKYAATGSVTNHHATRAGYAFKWQDKAVESVLESIEWSCAINHITPVAIFKPVRLEGTTVKRASLCNISECERLDIGGPGTKLSIIKANKIIPKCIKADANGTVFEVPKFCPVCGATTNIIVSPESGVKMLECTNPDCFAKQISKLSRFVSKKGFDINGLSIANLHDLIDMGLIKNEIDLIKLPDNLNADNHIKNLLINRSGWGKTSVNNLIKAITKARQSISADRFLYALSIPMCGQDVSKRLLGRFDSIQEVFENASKGISKSGFELIDGIGPEKTAAIENWFAIPRNQYLIKVLYNLCNVSDITKKSGNKCAGITFVITGDVHHFKNRDELKAYIESEGGKVSGSVSAKTGYLINNDINSTSGKNKKAKELNVPIISEDDFIQNFA